MRLIGARKLLSLLAFREHYPVFWPHHNLKTASTIPLHSTRLIIRLANRFIQDAIGSRIIIIRSFTTCARNVLMEHPQRNFFVQGAIDANPTVKQWVRNVEKEERFSFWFPTATDYFYPDFVCELTDGRVLVVEYKGEPYKTNDDSREKSQIGFQWQQSSNGRCIFLFAVQEDDQGRSVGQQIEQAIR